MDKLNIYHGSSEIIQKPIFGKGKLYNDYGQGFYCTEHLELAKEWACNEGIDGYANHYEIDMSNLKVLNLCNEEFGVLHWLALLLDNRILRVSTVVMKNSIQWLKDNYLIDISEYDIIIGYRADDSYFAFARAFINNTISLKQLSHAMQLGDLGEQIVIKSKKAFENLKYMGYFQADNTLYYIKRKRRDDDARETFLKIMENEDVDGIYMRDILRNKEVLYNEFL